MKFGFRERKYFVGFISCPVCLRLYVYIYFIDTEKNEYRCSVTFTPLLAQLSQKNTYVMHCRGRALATRSILDVIGENKNRPGQDRVTVSRPDTRTCLN
jgi:hypothetical protein